jgi:hypothetical protein
VLFAVVFFIYPAVTLCVVVFDSHLKTTGESLLVPNWFDSASQRYLSWANEFTSTNYAQSLDQHDVAGTEWPMFGSVFFLLTAEEMQKHGFKFRESAIEAVEKAAQVVASPVTATWVKTKWGEHYLDKENVFYRMLLILGLSSYEKITGSRQYHSLMAGQRDGLAGELAAAKYHLLDDYPGECYPNDVLWAVAAIQRAAGAEGIAHGELARKVLNVLDGPVKTAEGLPAFQVEAESARILQGARGCGSSGILIFAAELDRAVAGRWYNAYEASFWKDSEWIAGFRELPQGESKAFMDIDSGPVLFGFGSVASVFGVGAAKTNGRFDHAVPMTMEVVAFSWPTPFGLLVPGAMGLLAVKSWSLGEVAILFSMTRPANAEKTVPFTGHTPIIVWVLLVFYAGTGLLLIGREIMRIKRISRSIGEQK